MARYQFIFDDLPGAAQGLLDVIVYARSHPKSNFVFGPLTAASVLESGLWIDGQVDELSAILEKIPGAVRYD